MIISVDAERVLEKIQHSFYDKSPGENRTGGIYLNLIKALYDTLTANIVLIGEKTYAFEL